MKFRTHARTHALHALHSDFPNWAADRCAAEDRPYEFPPLREAYAHNGSWIRKIQHLEFPENVWIRYRLWDSRVENTTGLVDLVILPAPEAMPERLCASASIAFGDEAIVEGYGNLGIRVSLRVSRMTQSTGFRDDAAEHAFTALDRLTEWYLKLER